MTPSSTHPSHRTRCKPQFKAAKLFAALAVVGLAHQGMAATPAPNALPTGGQVVAGTATIASAGSTMNINQSSQRAVINWSSFDVGSQAKVNFNQPNAAAATLNFVNSASQSMINGAVNANGQVIFVNNNGIVFGRGAEVNVGGMVATTMNTSAAEFMSGRDIQTYEGGTTGKIINRGNITGNNINSYIALMAPQVKNTGVITATMSGNNAIALVSGQKVTLKFSGSQFVNVSVDASVVNSLISNKLLINAGSGQVIIAANAAQNLMGSIVRNAGTISASDISTAGGKISLTADTIDQSGVIEANSAQNAGGKISLKGNNITLASGSRTSTTGATAGGDICIGVNYTNEQTTESIKNAIQNNNLANEITVASNSVIDTSAIQNGNGGTINIWSRTRTSVAGNLYARAGAQGGNGGFIETSSKGVVELNQGLMVDTSSSKGRSGRWVIDPVELIIDAAAAASISNALNTTSVTLDATGSACTTTGCTQSQSPLIKILADIYTGNTATSLSLIATGGQIDINSNITAGSVYAVAQAINVNGSINTNGGSNSNIYLAGAIINILGNINSNGNSSNNSNTSTNTNSSTLNTVNTITANNRRNAINGNNQNTLNADGNTYISNGGLINIVATGDITISGNSYISANGQNGGTINIVSTAGKATINGIVDALGKSVNAGNILIAGKVETNLTGALISIEGLSQGGALNLGQINNLGNGTILAPPATAPPAPTVLLTFVQDSVTAALSNNISSNQNSITSNAVIIDSQTGINAPNGIIVVFGDQIQINNSSITASNGTIAIGREGYSSGALTGLTAVSNSTLIARKVETSGELLGTDSVMVHASEWLLDPTTVTIAAGAAGGSTGGSLASAIADAGAVTIANADIQNAINAGTSVTIVASGAITQSGALTFANSTANATLTLDSTLGSKQAITLSGGITATGSSSTNIVAKTAGGVITVTVAINVTGNVTLDNTFAVGGTTSGFINETNGITYIGGSAGSLGVKNTASITAASINLVGANSGYTDVGVWISGNLSASGNIDIRGTNQFASSISTAGSSAIYTNSAVNITSSVGEVIMIGKVQGTTANNSSGGIQFNNTATALLNITANKISLSGYSTNSAGDSSATGIGINSNFANFAINSGASYAAKGPAISFYGSSPVGTGRGLKFANGTIANNASGGDVLFVANNNISNSNNITVAANRTANASEIIFDTTTGTSSGTITNTAAITATTTNSVQPVNLIQKSNGATITDGPGAISVTGYISIDNTNGSLTTPTVANSNGVTITGTLSAGTLAGSTGVTINAISTGTGIGISDTASITSLAGPVNLTANSATGSAISITGAITSASGVNITGASTTPSTTVSVAKITNTNGDISIKGDNVSSPNLVGIVSNGVITQNANGGDITLKSNAGINVISSIISNGAAASDLNILAGGKININNPTSVAKTAAPTIDIMSNSGAMNVILQSSYAGNVSPSIFGSNVYIWSDIITRGGYLTIDGTGGTVAAATSGNVIAGETISKGAIANGPVYIEYGSVINTSTSGSTPLTASSTGGNINIAASRSVGQATGSNAGSFEQGALAKIYSGNAINLDIEASGNTVYNFIVNGRASTADISAVNNINVNALTTTPLVNPAKDGAVNITSPWTSYAGSININSVSTGSGVIALNNFSTLSGAEGININTSNVGQTGVNTLLFASPPLGTINGVFTSSSGPVNITNSSANTGATLYSGITLAGAVSGNDGVTIVNNSNSGSTEVTSGIYSIAPISSAAGAVSLTSTTSTGTAISLTSAATISALTGVKVIGISTLASSVVDTYGAVSALGAITNTGAGGVLVQSTANTATGSITDSGVGGISITGGYGIAAGTVTGGTITSVGTLSDTGGGVISLSMAQPTATPGTAGSIEAAAGVTTANASVSTNVAYSLRGGVMSTANSTVNNVNYRSPLAPIAISVALVNSYVTDYGVAYTDAAPQAWVKNALNSSVSFTGGGAFGANPDVNTILGSLSLNSVGGATGIAANRVNGAVTLIASDIFSVYGAVTITGAATYTVRPATLTITSRSASYVYDAATTYNTLTQAGYTVSGLISAIGGAPTGDAVTSTTSVINVGSSTGASVTGTNVATAGSYSVIESSALGTNLSNYTINYVRSTFNVTPAVLTVTAASDSKTYGTTTTNAGIAYNSSGVKTLASDGFTVKGLLGSDSVTSATLTSSLGAIATANASTTPYAITPSDAAGTGLSNYSITYVNGGLTVNKAVLTVTNPTMVYNGTTTFAAGTSGATATVTGVGGQTFTLGGSAAMTNGNVLGASNINSTTGLTFTGTGSSNYELPASISNVVITPAPLTVTLAPQSKTYDSTTAAVLTPGDASSNGSYTIAGFVSGQGAYITQTVGTYNSANASSSGLVSVASSVSAALAPADWTAKSGTILSNYSLPTSVSEAGTINKAPLAILANDVSTFTNTQPASGSLTYVVSGLVGADIPSTAFTVAPAVALASNASLATPGVFAGMVVPSVTAPNYTVTATPGTLTVLGSNAILVSVGTTSKVYGTYNQTQVAAGNIQADLAALATPIVTVQYKPAVSGVVDFTVTRNSSTGVWTAVDGVASNSATYTFSVTPTIPTGSYSTTNYLRVGSYALVPENLTLATGSTANCASCSVSYTSGTLTITPAQLLATVTPSAMTYNASTSIASTTVLTGTVGGVSGVQSGVTGITTLTAGSPNAGLQTINNGGTLLSGPDASNFTVTTTVLVPEASGPINGVVAPASATTDGSGYKIQIAPAPLVYTGVVRTSVYTSNAQTNSGATLTSGTLYSTDGFTIGGYASATNVSQGAVADSLAASPVGSTVANNYAITYNNGSLRITGAPLIITAESDTKTYGSTTTNAGIAYNAGVKAASTAGYTVGGLIGSDVVTSVTLSSSGALATADVVGSPYAITPSTAAGSLSNYTISYVNGALTVNPAVLTIASPSMVYNGTTTFAPGISSGTTTFAGVNDQTVTLGGSATMTNGNVLGTSAINNTSGLTVASVSGGVATSNYVLPATIANVDITPAPLTYTGVNTTTVFNNTQQVNSGATVTAGTLFGSDNFAISGYATKTDVSVPTINGVRTFTATPDTLLATALGSTNPNNYNITYVQGGLTITPAPLTATVTPVALTYNGNNTITSSTVLSGFVGGATDVLGATALTAGLPNAGTQTIINGGTTLTGTDSLNYAVTNTVLTTTTGAGANGVIAVSPTTAGSGYTIDIARRILVYTGVNTTHAYTGVEQTNGAAALTTGTVVAGESFTLGGYSKATNVSQGTVLDQLAATPATGTLAANYDIRYVNGSITITPLQLAVVMTPTTSSKVYDSTTAATLAAGTASTPGSYVITGFATGQGAYITQTAGTYNSANVAGATTITAALTPSVWATTGATDLSNYVLPTSATASATITPAPLSITANNAATFVGVAPTNLTYVINGLVGTDTPSTAFTVAPSVGLTSAGTTGLAAAGTYTAALVASVTAPNYTVTPTAGTLTVVGNSILVVSVGTSSQVFGTYNQTQVNNGSVSKAAPNVTVGYCSNCSDAAVIADSSLRSIVNLTVVAPTSGTTSANSLWTAYDSISGSGTGGATYAQGKYNFIVTPLITGSNYSTTGSYLNVGNYALVPSAVSTVSGYSTNYQGSPIYTAGNLQITPLTLTFAAAAPTQTYNGLTAINSLALTPNNLPTGITGITVTGSGNFTSPNASIAAGYTINNAVIAGADAANFVFAGATGNTGVINKAALTYTGVVRESVFNGAIQTNSGATLTAGTIATGESFSIGGYAQQRNVLATATPDVLLATAGANTLASNYIITYVNGSLKITPAPLTAAVTAGAMTYNGSNAINSTTVLTGFVGGATGVTGATTLTASLPDAGVQTIVNGGTLLSGIEAANYSVTNTVLPTAGGNGVVAVNAQPNGSGYTINIAKAPLTYTSGDNTVTFNGVVQTNSGATLSFGSVVAGQGFTLSGYASGTYVTDSPLDSLVATANPGTNLNNYAITFVNGSLSINPAPLTISGLVASNKTYDGNTVAVITGTPTLAGQIFANEPVTISSGSITQGVFASPDVSSSRNPTAVSAQWANFTLDNINYFIQGPTRPLAAAINRPLTTPTTPATPPSTSLPAAAKTPEPQQINNMVLIARQDASQAVVQGAAIPEQPVRLIKGEMLYVRDNDNPSGFLHAFPAPSSGVLKFPVPDQTTQELIEMTGEHIGVSGTPASFSGHNLLRLPNQSSLEATLEDGSALPTGIRFDASRRTFSIPKIGDVTLPISVKLSITRGKKVLSEKVMVVTK